MKKRRIQSFKSDSRDSRKMSGEKFVVVDTAYGPVKGIKKDTSLGQEIVSFQKIPYMKAPIGKLRFKVRLKLIIQMKIDA